MIRPRTALARIVQEFFHRDLIGIVRWDDVSFADPIEVLHDGPRRKRDQGRHRDIIDMKFGPFDLMVYGPGEADPGGRVFPCGQILLTSPHGTVTGPLDPSVWDKVGLHVKENINEERVNEHEHPAGIPWGR